MLVPKIFRSLIAIAVLGASTLAHADEWEFALAPYGLLPSMTGHAAVGRIDDAEVDLDPGDILKKLQFGAMVEGEARHTSGYGVLLNYAFMKLGENARGPLGFTDFDADIFQGMLEGFGTYRFAVGDSPIDAYAGVRWWDINIDVDASTPRGSRSLSRDKDWVDPVIGARWLPRVDKSWRFLLQGDVGGFDLASHFTWGVQGGAIWDAGERWSVVLLYKLLSVDFESGQKNSPSYFAYDTITQGPLLGLVIRF